MSKRKSRTWSALGIRRRPVPVLVGIAAGCAIATVLVSITATAVAQRSASGAGAVFDATHLPPLLTLPGEGVRLTYDVHCAPADFEVPERGCDVSGTLHVRGGERGAYRELELEPSFPNGLRQLTAAVPADVAANPDGFEYYAELRAVGVDEPLVIPGGGSSAPHRSLQLVRPTEVSLNEHAFGLVRQGARIVSAQWGAGAAKVGLEPGRSLPATGATSFDVADDGSVLLLDEAHRRALRWEPSGAGPSQVPLAIDGRLADLAIGVDGSITVLESVAAPGGTPVVRQFDSAGRVLDAVETAEGSPAALANGPTGPVVLQRPSNQWMPVAEAGTSIAPRDQRRRGRVGRPLRSGGEVVVLRRDREILAALVAKGHLERSWRIKSATPLAEVQLTEPIGRRLVVVVRAYTETADEFVVLVLDRSGLASQFSTPTDEWAESAPLGRFRLVGDRLYRLGSDASGVFVDRYDLGGSR